MTLTIVRLVLASPAAWTVDRGQALLEAAIARAPKEMGDAVLVTPGGFLRARWPDDWNGRSGWESRPSDLAPLVTSAEQVVRAALSTEILRRAHDVGFKWITVGVDVLGREPTHAELVAVVSTSDGDDIRWTGKSYPTSSQERELVHVTDLSTHCVELGGERVLVLGCQDLNMFSARARANQNAGSVRHRRCEEMTELAAEFAPTMVLQHPHTTDTPRLWATAWSGLRKRIPSIRSWASGIWYRDMGSAPPRGDLPKVLASTASDDVVDITLALSLPAGVPVLVQVPLDEEGSEFGFEWGEIRRVESEPEGPFEPPSQMCRTNVCVVYPVALAEDGYEFDAAEDEIIWYPDTLESVRFESEEEE